MKSKKKMSKDHKEPFMTEGRGKNTSPKDAEEYLKKNHPKKEKAFDGSTW